MKESSGLHKKFTLEDSAGPQTQLSKSHEVGRRAVAQAKANQKNRNQSNYGTDERGYFRTNTKNRKKRVNSNDFGESQYISDVLYADPDGRSKPRSSPFRVTDYRNFDEQGNQTADTAGGYTAEKEYDELPDNIFKTSDNSLKTSKISPDSGKSDLSGNSQDSGGMAKAPSFGFEAFLDNQLGMSGGRTLSGFDKVSGGVYKHGPAKGMTRGQYYEKARAQYAALSDDEKKNWESRAKMKDVRSTRDQAAQQQYEDKLGFNSNQDEKPKTEKAEEEKQSKGNAEPMMTSVLKNQKDRQRKTNLNKSATDKPSIEYLA